MRRAITSGLVLGLLIPHPAVSQTLPPPAPGSALAQYVERLPSGSTVKLQLQGGRRMKAILMVVEPAAIVVRPKTRVPEPALRVPLASLEFVEIDEGRSNPARAIAIGMAAGAAGAVTFLLVMLAAFGD
jgi:hypothetical protein